MSRTPPNISNVCSGPEHPLRPEGLPGQLCLPLLWVVTYLLALPALHSFPGTLSPTEQPHWNPTHFITMSTEGPARSRRCTDSRAASTSQFLKGVAGQHHLTAAPHRDLALDLWEAIVQPVGLAEWQWMDSSTGIPAKERWTNQVQV